MLFSFDGSDDRMDVEGAVDPKINMVLSVIFLPIPA